MTLKKTILNSSDGSQFQLNFRYISMFDNFERKKFATYFKKV